MAFFGGSSVDLTSPGPIGSTTPNTGRFTTLTLAPSANTTPFTASGYSLTGTNAQSLFDLSGTWNTSGTPTAFKLNVTDTASNASSLLMDLQVGGSSRATINKSGQISANVGQLSGGFGFAFLGGTNGIYSPSSSGSWYLASSGNASAEIRSSGLGLGSNSLSWGSIGSTQDVILTRDASAILAQRNSTNAQTFRLYNTYTDASNYERGFMRWATNVLEIGAEAAGTGTQRQLRFPLGTVTASTPLSITQTWNSAGVTFTGLQLNATDTASASGSLLFDFQVGGSSKCRVNKNGDLTITGGFNCTQNSTLDGIITRQAAIYGGSDANGTLILQNSNFNNFNMLKIGGTSSSFPALKRSSAVLQARLADDSGFAQVQGKLTTDTNYTVTAPIATGYLTIYDASGTAYKVLCST